MTYNVYFYVCMQNFRLLCSSCLLLLLLLLVCYTKHLFAFSRNWMQNIVIHFFLSQEFQSGDPGIPVSKLDSICPGKTWELLQIRKTKTCVQENSSCLLVWHRRLCMPTFFFTRTRLKTFFQYFYCIPRRSATEFLRMVPQK